MANEITMVGQLTVLKGSLSFGIPRLTKLLTWTGTKYTQGTQTIGFAAHELVALGSDHSSAVGGMCLFINLDPTNYLELGIDDSATFEPLIRLVAGDFCMFRSTTSAIYARANTAACELQKLLMEA